jgi:hypothetical protein
VCLVVPIRKLNDQSQYNTTQSTPTEPTDSTGNTEGSPG